MRDYAAALVLHVFPEEAAETRACFVDMQCKPAKPVLNNDCKDVSLDDVLEVMREDADNFKELRHLK
eukprot:6504448-Alexandrium_andersonii.AAC.1